MTEIVEKCDLCARHKTPPKPVVGTPLAEDYNRTVAVDLHELDRNIWYFHMNDEYTRFSAAVIIWSKQASVIVESFMKHWTAIHGPPKVVLSDNGSEFNNEEFRDVWKLQHWSQTYWCIQSMEQWFVWETQSDADKHHAESQGRQGRHGCWDCFVLGFGSEKHHGEHTWFQPISTGLWEETKLSIHAHRWITCFGENHQ